MRFTSHRNFDRIVLDSVQFHVPRRYVPKFDAAERSGGVLGIRHARSRGRVRRSKNGRYTGPFD